LLAAELVALAAVVGTSATGIAPWSVLTPAGSSGGPAGVSFDGALMAASSAVTTYAPSQAWVATSAIGIDVPTSFAVPWFSNGTGTPVYVSSGCELVPVSSTSPSNLSVPSTPSVGRGLSNAWFLEYRAPSGSTLLVTVFDGVAAVLAGTSGPQCPLPSPVPNGSTVGIGPNVIDSTVAAGVVDAWGGSAFLANHTSSSAIMMISAPVVVSYVGNASMGGGGGYSGNGSGGLGGNGSGPPPPPVPPPISPPVQASAPMLLVMPSTWSFAYTAAVAPSVLPPILGMTPSVLLATVDAGNATLIDLFVGAAPFLGFGGPPVGVGTPPLGGPPSIFTGPTASGAGSAGTSGGSSNGTASPPAPWSLPSSSPGSSVGSRSPGTAPGRPGVGPASSLNLTGLALLGAILAGLGVAIGVTRRERAPPPPPARPEPNSGTESAPDPLDGVL
jgi:hypothetical protein